MQRLHDFDGARSLPGPADRLRELVRRAAAFRERFLEEPPVRYYRSFALVRVPYPTRFGLLNVQAHLQSAWLHIVNRVFILQYEDGPAVRTLLFSPSDVEANRATPYFKRLSDRFAALGEAGRQLLSPVLGSVEAALRAAGLGPEEVDYLSFDHLHTQDLRRWLGSAGRAAFFPKARLLVMRQEWESALALLPSQAEWYCPGGLEGIPPEKIELLEGDVQLGSGVALLRTPGHTEGNHSLVARTPEGIMVTSENGIGPDAYAPLASHLPGVAQHAARTGIEVVLNGNTLEGAVDQYLSMVQEREIAGRSLRHPDFYNVVSSSELAGYWAFPRLTPTFSFGDLCFGAPVRA